MQRDLNFCLSSSLFILLSQPKSQLSFHGFGLLDELFWEEVPKDLLLKVCASLAGLSCYPNLLVITGSHISALTNTMKVLCVSTNLFLVLAY